MHLLSTFLFSRKWQILGVGLRRDEGHYLNRSFLGSNPPGNPPRNWEPFTNFHQSSKTWRTSGQSWLIILITQKKKTIEGINRWDIVYIILYYIMLCYLILCYVILYYIILLYHIILYYVMYHITLYHIILYHIILYHIILYYIILYYIIL